MNSNETTKVVATWILVVSGLFAVMEIGAAVSLFFFPETMADQIDLAATGTRFLMYMWATRQFALGVIIGFATFQRSIPMLTLSYAFLLVMFAGDCLVGAMQHDTALQVSAAVMGLIAIIILFSLRTNK